MGLAGEICTKTVLKLESRHSMKVFWLALRDASLSWVYQPVPFELPPTQTGPGPLENPSITEKSPLGARMDEPECSMTCTGVFQCHHLLMI